MRPRFETADPWVNTISCVGLRAASASKTASNSSGCSAASGRSDTPMVRAAAAVSRISSARRRFSRVVEERYAHALGNVCSADPSRLAAKSVDMLEKPVMLPPRPCKAGDNTVAHGVSAEREDDRDGAGRPLRSPRRGSPRNDDVDVGRDQLGRHGREPLALTLAPTDELIGDHLRPRYSQAHGAHSRNSSTRAS